MSQLQQRALIIGGLLFAAAFLFPPVESTSRSYSFRSRQTEYTVSSEGFQFIGSLKAEGSNKKSIVCMQWAIELLALGGATAFAFVVLGKAGDTSVKTTQDT